MTQAAPGDRNRGDGTHPFTLDVPVEFHVPADPDGSLVVALHGMGQSAASFAKDALPCAPARACVLIPQGPLPYEIRSGDGPPRQGNAWYVYTGESAGFLRSMERTEAWLLSAVDAAVGGEFGRADLDPRRVALVGFSQGGYLAGFVAVRHAERFRALVVAGGRIKDEALAGDAPRAAAAGLRVLDVHGEDDPSVKPGPCRASAERLASFGVSVDFRTYACGHAVLRDERCRADVRAFLAAGAGDALNS